MEKNIRQLFIDFFLEKNHKQIKSASLIPDNNSSSLFNIAGMQQLLPCLMGQPHPLGKRLVNYQKCLRTNDLDIIGDNYHHTFFEMLGSWSLGDYFKEESLNWSYEFLTEVIKIPKEKLAVTIFKGNENLKKDYETLSIWREIGITDNKIAFLVEDNLWGMGDVGPCGPCSEIFYWRSNEEVPEAFDPEDERWVEIWNNVFMEYYKHNDGSYTSLENKNIDTGMGLERMTSVIEGVSDNYLTSIFKDVINKIEKESNLSYQDNKQSMRIIADHLRAIMFLAGDENPVQPSNVDQGYVLRRLIRRVVRESNKLKIDVNNNYENEIIDIYLNQYQEYYLHLKENEKLIKEVYQLEKSQFLKTLQRGLKEFDKIKNKTTSNKIDGKEVFKLYDTYGFPFELVQDLAKENNLSVSKDEFDELFKLHQEKSRAGNDTKFQGGLADEDEMTIKYHTATHLLNAALKEVLGSHVHQQGSNITSQRLRFDFSHHQKVTKEEQQLIEDKVNEYIQTEIEVTKRDVTKEEAVRLGAEAMFLDRYDEIVTIYQIGDISLEVCGGPHIKNTKELGTFKIKKEEASSKGVRRIKAILE